MAASHVNFEGYLKFVLPLVKEHQSVTVDAGLFDDKNKLIHDSAYNIEKEKSWIIQAGMNKV